jgi:hypothetical protein
LELVISKGLMLRGGQVPASIQHARMKQNRVSACEGKLVNRNQG